MRILVITATRIGDAVLSTGLVDHLRQTYPEARFTIAAGPAAAPLFAALPGLEQSISMAKRRYGSHWLALWGDVVGKRWDLVVDLRRSGLSYALWAKRRVIAAKADPALHRVEALGRVLRLDPPPAPVLWLAEQHRTAAKARMRAPAGVPVLALGPGANWRGKIWPVERFITVMEALTSPSGPLAGAHVAVFGAAADRTGAAPLLEAIPAARRIDLVGNTGLLSAAACLEKARLFIGNDSGLMHLAATAGAPTLGLFGPSRPEHYAPWGEHCAWVRTAIPYDGLFGPGYDHRTTETLMTSLSETTVIDAAQALLERNRG